MRGNQALFFGGGGFGGIWLNIIYIYITKTNKQEATFSMPEISLTSITSFSL